MIEEADAEVEALIEDKISQAKRSANEIITEGEREARQLSERAQSKISDAGAFVASQVIG